MSNDWLKDLKKTYLFSTLTPDELSSIAAVALVKTFEPGDTVYSQGEKPEALFIVRYGTVKAAAWGVDSQVEEGFGLLGNGSVFGDSSLLSQSPRTSSVEVVERTEVIRIGFTDLTTALESKPAIALKVYKALGWHLGILFERTAKEVLALRTRARSHR